MTKPTPAMGRVLTAGEITLAREVFGNSLDYDRVRITEGRFHPLHPRGTGMAPNGNLYMYGCYSPDYSLGTLQAQAHFIHEMVHVWQYQNKVLDPITAAIQLTLKHKFNYMAAYNYNLASGRDLLSYNMEQQATIIQDYFLLTRSNGLCHTGRCQNNAQIDVYQNVLANFLTDPSYVRQNPPPKGPAPKI